MMLRRFVDLSDGDFVIQNGANSAVGRCSLTIRSIVTGLIRHLETGQSVIQIARARGLRTINLVRNR